MFRSNYRLILMFLLTAPCIVGAQTKVNDDANFDKQAHRGGSGLMPENSIPAMLNAIDLGVNTLEMDLHISKDKKVLVSHNPHMNYKSTTTPDGLTLTKEESESYMLFQMPYDSIKLFDIGMKPNPEFPQQKKIKTNIPLFADLIKAVEAHAAKKGVKIHYNVEVKSRADGSGDGTVHPAVGEFVDLVMADILKAGIQQRCMVQSFDIRALKLLHQKYPAQTLSYLYGGPAIKNVSHIFNELGFVPKIFSPVYHLASKEMIDYCHSKKVKIVAWTPNKSDEIKALRKLGVDGVISDYPTLFFD